MGLFLRYVGLALAFLLVGSATAHVSDWGRAVPRVHESLYGISVAQLARLPFSTSASALNRANLPTKDIAMQELPGAEWSLGAAFSEGKVMTGSTPHRLILFTFDDGPDVRYTPALLRELDRVNVKAVFFLTARRIDGDTKRQRRRIAIARDMVRRGHILANHTYDHEHLTLLDNGAVQRQIIAGERAFRRVFGRRPWLFRPPGGSRSPRVDRLVEERGYTTVMWNLGTGDTQVSSARDVVRTWKRVLYRRNRETGDRGGIVLLHDTHPWSVDAFREIYREIQRRNCRLLEKGEELYDIVDDPSLFFSPRSGDSTPGSVSPPAKLSPAMLETRQRRLRRKIADRCRSEGPRRRR